MTKYWKAFRIGESVFLSSQEPWENEAPFHMEKITKKEDDKTLIRKWNKSWIYFRYRDVLDRAGGKLT